MMAYASRTGTRRNIDALRGAGWGWIVGPLDHGSDDMFGMPYALDNGAWPAFSQGIEWDRDAFLRALDRYGPRADFVVIPDVVAHAEASIALTRKWMPRLLERPELKRLLIAVQDGMDQAEIAQLAESDQRIGLFIGGSTEWKLQAIIPWGRWAKARGLYCHVGRVNTTRRIMLCSAAGADSFDGTSVTRYVANLAKLDGARRQGSLL